MAKKCLCKPQEILIFPCSGASNVGQIANQAAVQLTEEGVGNMFCLAGIGAHLDGMIEGAKTAKRIVAIDGCSTECATKTLKHAGISVTHNINVISEGIAKNHYLKISQQDVKFVVRQIKLVLKRPQIKESS